MLCLDGGGVKGIVSLQILQTVMTEVSREKYLRDNPDGPALEDDDLPVLKPCDYFDLICGTSTGGLIAIMLGRLGYVSRVVGLALFLTCRLIKAATNRTRSPPPNSSLSFSQSSSSWLLSPESDRPSGEGGTGNCIGEAFIL
jgi:hypothetical protein